MSKQSSSSEVADKLYALAVYLLRDSKKEEQASGLTSERLSLLSILFHTGPQTINSLAETEQVSAPAITRTVKSLEKLGYVIKSRSKTDQRMVYVAPTRKCHLLLEEARRNRVEGIEQLLHDVSEEDLHLVVRGLAIMERQIVKNS